jgi:hypothetical protein
MLSRRATTLMLLAGVMSMPRYSQAQAQTEIPASPQHQGHTPPQAPLVTQKVTSFFEAIANHDTSTMRKLIVAGAMITSTGTGKDHAPLVVTRQIDAMIFAVGHKAESWVYTLSNVQPTITSVDPPSAQVIAKLKFAVNGTPQFCGDAVVSMAKDSDWKVQAITENQRPCQ